MPYRGAQLPGEFDPNVLNMRDEQIDDWLKHTRVWMACLAIWDNANQERELFPPAS